ncbi:hypothetical protein KI387_015779, partial [Taxus chinensis]
LADEAFKAMITVFWEMASDLTKHNASLVYGALYAAHPQETQLAVLMMVTVGCYALPDSEGGRFFRGLMRVLRDMIEDR